MAVSYFPQPANYSEPFSFAKFFISYLTLSPNIINSVYPLVHILKIDIFFQKTRFPS